MTMTIGDCEHPTCTATAVQLISASWVDADGGSDGTTWRVCAECLTAGSTAGPGYRAALTQADADDADDAGREDELRRHGQDGIEVRS